MAEKKPKKKQGRPKGRKDVIPVQVRISPDLHAALGALIQDTRRSKNAEFTLALEEYLKRQGLWPKSDN